MNTSIPWPSFSLLSLQHPLQRLSFSLSHLFPTLAALTPVFHVSVKCQSAGHLKSCHGFLKSDVHTYSRSFVFVPLPFGLLLAVEWIPCLLSFKINANCWREKRLRTGNLVETSRWKILRRDWWKIKIVDDRGSFWQYQSVQVFVKYWNIDPLVLWLINYRY